MKFSVSWLKDYLKTDADLDGIIDAMILAGLEVEEVENPAEKLKAFTAAKVVKAEQHPDADKLRVCTVETKDGTKQIVCGAPNARTGMTAVYAPLGAYIPGLDFALDKKPRKLRGVESSGMMCSATELEVGSDSDGIMELADEVEVGAPIAQVLGLDDAVIDFEVTPNRPDWLGITGIARDLAAAGLGEVNIPDIPEVKGTFPCPIEVTSEDTDACPVFMGRVIKGVKNGPSPDWMQARLKSIGINPKNMLVDVTNYVSFDRCRPLHAYDADKLQGNVSARLAKAGEKLKALDDNTYDLSEDMCVIADESGPVGIGGVMGGAVTGSTDDTVNIFLESALFDPLRTARTGRSSGIVSDARYRNERGIDPNSCREGLDLATQLILNACGGEASEVVIGGAVPAAQDAVEFKPVDMKRLTGVDMTADRMKEILATLGFGVEKKAKIDDAVWKITVPGFRRDVFQSADIVEELIRIEGFDALPTESLPREAGAAKQVVTPLQNRVRTARRVLATRGFLEGVSWSFMDRETAKSFGGGDNDALVVDNPIANDLNYMRPTALANLAQAIQRNVDHGAEEVRLFEVGPVYLGDGPKDQRTAVTSLVKPRPARHWAGAIEAYDAYAAKADLFAVLSALDQPGERFQIGEPVGDHWHPGRAASIRLGPKNVIGTFGQLHPAVLKKLDIEGPLVGFEIYLEALPQVKSKGGKTKQRLEKADLTPIRRDFAFLADSTVQAGDISKAAGNADKKLITASRVFDVYEGEGMPDGKKSVAIEVTLQPRETQLKDADIEKISKSIVAAVAKATKAELRG